MQQSATPEPATGPDPVRRRPGGGAVTAASLCRRGDRVRILVTTPCNNQPHQSLPPGQTRGATTRRWRCDRGAVLPPGRPSENFGNNPGLRRGRLPCEVSHTRACHRARPVGRRAGRDGSSRRALRALRWIWLAVLQRVSACSVARSFNSVPAGGDRVVVVGMESPRNGRNLPHGWAVPSNRCRGAVVRSC